MSERRHLVLAVVTDICDEDVTYPSCQQCCSKLFVDDTSSSQNYLCLKCGSHCCQQSVQHRYRLVLAVSDGHITGRVVVFGCTLDGFFGKTARDFHRSLFELGKSGYPAEAMLSDSLMKTFLGKYFYFGIKASDLVLPDPPSLKDMLHGSANAFSDKANDQYSKDTSHTLVYQMIQCNDGVYATVTDHMRYAVNSLRTARKGEPLQPAEINLEVKEEAEESSRHSSGLAESHFECSSLCKTSSIHSKQISVMFSFENDSYDVDSGKADRQTYLCDNEARPVSVDVACSLSCEENVHPINQEDFEDFCRSAMNQYPVTQNLNFTNLDDTDISDKNTGYSVVKCPQLLFANADHLKRQNHKAPLSPGMVNGCNANPLASEHIETQILNSYEGNGQINPSQCNDAEAMKEIESAPIGDEIQHNSVAVLYLPDSEGLSAFLDTFEDDSEVSESQCEENDGDFMQNAASIVDTCSVQELSHECKTGRTEHLICDVHNITVIIQDSKCSKEVEHAATDVCNKSDPKGALLSESDDLEAFLNCFDEEMNDENISNLLDVKEAQNGSENHLTVTVTNKIETLTKESNSHINSEEKEPSQSAIKQKEALKNVNESGELVSVKLDTLVSQMNKHKKRGVKIDTKTTDYNSEDDSGFSQNDEIEECIIKEHAVIKEKAVSSCLSDQNLSGSTSSCEDLQTTCKEMTNQVELTKGNQYLNEQYEVRFDTDDVKETKLGLPQHFDVDSDKENKENHSKQTSKPNLNDLEMFLAEISLDTDSSRKSMIINTETVCSSLCFVEEITANQQEGQAFGEVENDHNHSGYSQVNKLTVDNCDELNCHSDETCKHRSVNISSASTDDCLCGTEIVCDTQESNNGGKDFDKSENLQLNLSEDLFDDSGNWCLQNDAVCSMINDSSEDSKKLNELTDSDAEDKCMIETEIIITESQDVNQNISDHFHNIKRVKVQVKSPASGKHVQFDRRLQQVISCQLMDVRMKLRGSPVERLGRRSLLKPCLKTREIKDTNDENCVVKTYQVHNERSVTSAVEGGGFNTFSQSGNEKTEAQVLGEMTFVGGSQDLFGPSPDQENNKSLLNDVRQSSGSFAGLETDTPDIFVSRDYVFKMNGEAKDNPVLTPDIFTQESSSENCQTTPDMVWSEGIKRANNVFCSSSSSSSTKRKFDNFLWKEMVTQKANNMFRLLVENTPDFEKSGKVSVTKKQTTNLLKKITNGSPPKCEKVLREVEINYQDSPDLFDSSDLGSCDEFDQSFMHVPAQSQNLVKKLFF